jgi:uncharacterized membrane protein
VAGLCYLSFGLIGLLYIIVNGKGANESFLRFHFLQSIVLGIFNVLLSWTGSSMYSILQGIFGLFGGDGAVISASVLPSVITIFGLVSKVMILLGLYGMLWAFLGKFAEIPFLSDLVRQQLR